jgi:hypothetical protein
MSDSRDLLMLHSWHLSNGGAMTLARCRRFGCVVRAMTVSAGLRYFGSGTHVVHIGLSQNAWSSF